MSAYETEAKVVIHRSRWAITQKQGDKIYKIFLHNAYPKIKKEVSLLQLSLPTNASLLFDNAVNHWVCRSDYMDIYPLVGNICIDNLIPQLRQVFDVWRYDHRYCNLVADEWFEVAVPWYSALLQQYLPNSEKLVSWLQHSQGKHFIHGDFTLSNVYLDSGNKIVVIDYENATLGPLLWDETTLVYSFIEQKQFDIAKQIYDAFRCNKEMLRTICSIRLAQSMRKSQNVMQRFEAYEFVMHNY